MPSTNGRDGSTVKVTLYVRVSGEEQARRESSGRKNAADKLEEKLARLRGAVS